MRKPQVPIFSKRTSLIDSQTHPIVTKLTNACALHSDPSRIEYMSGYMKNQFEFYGIPASKLQLIIAPIWKTEKDLIRRDLRIIVSQLWDEEHRELHYIGQNLLNKCQKYLDVNDLDFIRKLIITNSWWDTVDLIASNALATVLKSKIEEQLKWSNNAFQSNNLWLIRSAIIFQLKYKDEVNERLLFDNILKCKNSQEFFIQKACGWALRQYSKYNGNAVRGFLDEHESHFSKLTIREASKYI